MTNESNKNMSNVIFKLKCYRCDYEWIPRKEELPKTCPRCRAITWNKKEKTTKGGYRDGRSETIWKERIKQGEGE